jgi:hypothetical protein
MRSARLLISVVPTSCGNSRATASTRAVQTSQVAVLSTGLSSPSTFVGLRPAHRPTASYPGVSFRRHVPPPHSRSSARALVTFLESLVRGEPGDADTGNDNGVRAGLASASPAPALV